MSDVTTTRFKNYRNPVKFILALIYFGLPFVKIGGESALRFDIPSLRLYLFGTSIWIENFFIILVFTFFITFLFISLTQIYGRIWCGWMCPQTIFCDYTGFMAKLSGSPVVKKVLSHLAVLGMSVLISAASIWYFVSPYEFLARYASGNAGAVINSFMIVLVIISYLNFAFWRRKFCATICPYSMLQSVMFDDKTLIVSMKQDRMDECVSCNGCVNVCPTGIDIRQGYDSKCIACAQCIDACANTMTDYHAETLIGYQYGEQNKKKFFRPTVMITSAITLIFGVLLLFLALTMTPYEFEVFPNQQFLPRYKDGYIINSYEIKIKNTTDKKMNVSISIPGVEGYKITPDTKFTVDPDKTFKEKVFLFLPEKMFEKKSILGFKFISKADDAKTTVLESDASFRRPIRRKK